MSVDTRCQAVHEVSFKPWPACRHAHPTIDAALALRRRLADREIVSVEVQTFRDAIVFCDRPEPRTVHEAKFSLQHCVAVGLLSGKPQISDFDPDRIAERKIASLRGRITVHANDRFTSAYPSHFGAEVSVSIGAGEVLREAVTDAWGDNENPLAESDVLTKFFALAAHAEIQHEQAKNLADAALSLPGVKSTSHLRAALHSLELGFP